MTTINPTDPVEAVLRANGWSQATLTADMTVPVYLIETSPRLILPGQIGEYSPLIGVDVLRPPYPVGTVARSRTTGYHILRAEFREALTWLGEDGDIHPHLASDFEIVYTPAADYTQAGDQA